MLFSSEHLIKYPLSVGGSAARDQLRLSRVERSAATTEVLGRRRWEPIHLIHSQPSLAARNPVEGGEAGTRERTVNAAHSLLSFTYFVLLGLNANVLVA